MTRFIKVYRDLIQNKPRAILAVLSIVLGVMGIGTVLNTNYLLNREMKRSYMDTNPASFVLWADKADEKLTGILKEASEIKDIEFRKTVTGRIQTAENQWGTIILYVIEDFNSLRIDTFKYEKGVFPPLDNEILIERDAFGIANTIIGEAVQIKIPGGEPKSLRVAGSVHAPGLPAAHAEHFSYGFISQKALENLGDESGLREIRIVVSGDVFNKNYIEETANTIKDICGENGYVIRSIEIPEPGKHPHGDEMSGFLFVVQAFGVLSLLMSSVLVINMISNLLAGQIRQIGIMKSMGAKVLQISGMYYAMVLMISFVSLLIAIPLAALIGQGCASFSAMELNFDIKAFDIPPVSFIIQGITGIFIPLIAATIPVARACRIPVREAISDFGISQYKPGISGKGNRLLATPLLLGIRNTFRKKGRVLLTLGSLILGGALFIVSLNIYTSLHHTVEQSFRSLQYDVEVRLSKPYAIESLEANVKDIQGVNKIEYMNFSTALLRKKDSISSKQYLLKAVPTDATLIKLPVLEGRWYESGEKNSIVINHNLANKEPDIHIGDFVDVHLEGSDLRLRVVGIVKEVASRPTIYMDRAVYSSITGNSNLTNYVLFKTDRRDSDLQKRVLTSFEKNSEENRLDILDAWMTYQHRRSFLDHLGMVLIFLIFMAVLTVIVGGTGLASSMGISVIERMREIGVMRSIGASGSNIIKIVLIEGLIIGTISWFIVCLLSIPLAFTIGNQIGIIALHIELDTAFSVISYFAWLALISIVTLVSCLIPAARASHVPVRDILTYE